MKKIKYDLKSNHDNEHVLQVDFRLKNANKNINDISISDDVIGFLKFTENQYLDLTKNGVIHFCDPKDFLKSEEKSRQDDEGTAINIDINSKQTYKNFGWYTMQAAMKISFKDRDKVISKSSWPFKLDNNLQNAVENFTRRTLMSELLQNDYDIFIRPISYLVDSVSNSVNIDKAKIIFHEGHSYNGLITSFITVKKSDVDEFGTLSSKFIESLSKSNSDNIAFSFNDNYQLIPRPWVWISKEKMVKMLQETTEFDFRAGEVRYYDKEYPFTANELRSQVGINLFAKNSKYSNQREFRIFYGGPNSKYKSLPVDDKLNYKFNLNGSEFPCGTLNQLGKLNLFKINESSLKSTNEKIE